LRRSRYLQTFPLIIGSMVSDAPYFLPTQWDRLFPGDTHSLYATFAFCLPMGMAILVLTVALREPLTVLLGPRVRWLCLRSLDRFMSRPLNWPLAIVSIVLGAWTHIAWDSFTHEYTWTTARVPALTAPVSLFGWDTATTHLLQYLSSVFGLVIMAVWFRGLLNRVPREAADSKQPRANWLVLLMIGFFALLIGVSRAFMSWHVASYYHLEYLLLTRTICWFFLLYLGAGLVALLARRLEPEPAG
jgi:hypothetical protein